MNNYAVITADLVSSRNIDVQIREQLYIAIDEFAKALKRKWIDKYERFRGDSFQCTTFHIQQSLRAALMLRCYVLAYEPNTQKQKLNTKGYSNTQFDVRLAIGIGGIDFINDKKLSSSDGEAFALSGQSLDNLKKGGERMVLKTTDEKDNEEWETVLTLLDAIMQKWTQNGAELVLQKLLGKKDDEIADHFKISLSAVTQRKKNAQWHAINKTVLYFESKFLA